MFHIFSLYLSLYLFLQIRLVVVCAVAVVVLLFACASLPLSPHQFCFYHVVVVFNLIVIGSCMLRLSPYCISILSHRPSIVSLLSLCWVRISYLYMLCVYSCCYIFSVDHITLSSVTLRFPHPYYVFLIHLRYDQPRYVIFNHVILYSTTLRLSIGFVRRCCCCCCCCCCFAVLSQPCPLFSLAWIYRVLWIHQY
ncbi:hypothetical protein V8B55DRAFT_1084073 [Mucor lusitanicus]